jgi:hypothetical protein
MPPRGGTRSGEEESFELGVSGFELVEEEAGRALFVLADGVVRDYTIKDRKEAYD